MKEGRRRPVAVLLWALLSGLLVGLAAAGLGIERRHESSIASAEAASLLRLQASVVEREYAAVRSDLRLLAGDGRLRAMLEGEAEERQRLGEAWVQFAAARGRYDQVRYLDSAGREIVRVNDDGGSPRMVAEPELQPKGKRYYVPETLALRPGELFVSRLDLNIEHGAIERPNKPMVRFATPVADAAGATVGLVILNYLAERLLSELDSLAAGHGLRFELLDHEGSWLRGPSPETEWGFMFGSGRGLAGEQPEAWGWLNVEEAGQVEGGTGLLAWRRFQPAGQRVAGPLHLLARADAGTIHGGSRRLRRSSAVALAVLLPLLLAAALSLARSAEARAQAAAQLAESEARLRQLTLRLLEAQEQERLRFSRDLHDDLGQIGSTLRIDAEQARRASSAEPREEALARLSRTAELLLGRIREIAQALRPPLLDDIGLAEALRRHAAEFQARSGIAVELAVEPPAPASGGDREPREAGAVLDHAFRIVQEALLNVARHSGASRVAVTLRRLPDNVEVSVVDDGKGFDSEHIEPGRLGILGMRERAELLGGRFEFSSGAGRGTRVTAQLPAAGSRA